MFLPSIKATHLELTPDLRQLLEEKLQNLDRFYDPILNLDVEIEKTTDHHRKGDVYRAEVNVTVPNDMLRAETVGENIHAVIVEVKDIIEEKLVDYKEKLKSGGI
ncbi:MAG: ribosome-associated translation inhibitor RaiA [Parcubacteria group bacterium]|nr:ribosome-associated translation inhibitor RaiA [Parcubacteria group bacterium]